MPNNRDSSVPIGDVVDGVPRIDRPTIEPDRIVEPAMFEPFLAALVTVRAQRLQLTIPEFDRIVVMRLDMVRDTCRDDLAFAQAYRTKRLVLKLTARPAVPRGFGLQPGHSTKCPLRIAPHIISLRLSDLGTQPRKMSLVLLTTFLVQPAPTNHHASAEVPTITAVIRHFQERMPYDCSCRIPAAPERVISAATGHSGVLAFAIRGGRMGATPRCVVR